MTPDLEKPDLELRAWLRCVRAARFGAPSLRRLADRFGSLAEALATGRRGWQAAGLETRLCDALEAVPEASIDADLAWLTDDAAPHPRRFIALDDAEFPTLLAESPHPPIGLFVVGDAGLLWQPQLAIVGSRHPTAAGLEHARAFASACSRSGFTITSGLAEGVDAAAHRAALDAGGGTIAVMGTGPDTLYPRVNRALGADIAARGVLVTEFAPGTGARREHFPRRNRIIAGLSLGTLVVEAGVQSGALISARMAVEAGREIMAIPGSIHNPLARGCHRLIREGAALIETVDEVVDVLRSPAMNLGHRLRTQLGEATDTAQSAPCGRRAAAAAPDPDRARTLDAMGYDPCRIEQLAERTGLTIPALSAILLVLELDGQITAEHGRYTRTAPPTVRQSRES